MSVPPSSEPTCGRVTMLAPSRELSWLAMTPDQAQILYQVVLENRANITQRWSPGICDGLSEALCEIDRAGGAYIRELPPLHPPP